MKSSKALTALLASGLVTLAGCRGQEPPKTLAECQERRTQEIQSVFSGLRNIAPEGTADADWFEEGVNRLKRNDFAGYVSVIRVCSRSVIQALGPLRARIENINLKYDKYEAALSGKPWPPVPPAPLPQREPAPPAANQQPIGPMAEAVEVLPKRDSAELQLARAQLATAEARLRFEAARGGSPEAQRAAAQEVARLSQLVVELSQKELSGMEANLHPAEGNTQLAIATAQALYEQALAELPRHPETTMELVARARRVFRAPNPLGGVPFDRDANNLNVHLFELEMALERPEVLYRLAQHYKNTDPEKARKYLRDVLNVQPDQALVRQLIPLHRELFPGESTEELEAFAAGKPSPHAEAEARAKEAEPLRKRQQRALQYYRSAVNLQKNNPKAAQEYLQQALTLDPDKDLRNKIERLQATLDGPQSR
jgi:tetratricopeptide (TPR) repeat protein